MKKLTSSLVFVGDLHGFETSSKTLDLVGKIVERTEMERSLAPAVSRARTGDAKALSFVHEKLDGGLFDVTLANFSTDPTKPNTYSDYMSMYKPYIDAFLNAYNEARFHKATGEPGFGVFPVPLIVTLAHSVPEMAPAMAKVFDALVLQDKLLVELGVVSGVEAKIMVRTTLFAQALSMACIMGMPESIGPLAARCPQAMRHPLYLCEADPFDHQGPWSQHMPFGKTSRATPPFFALQFGHPECIDALRQAGLERQFSFVCAQQKDNDIEGNLVFHPVAQHEFFSRFDLAILPSQLSAMLDRMDHRVVANNPGMKAIEALNISATPSSLRSFLPVFMESGTFDKIPTADVIVSACVHNVPEVIEQLKGDLPWSSMDSKLLVSVALQRVNGSSLAISWKHLAAQALGNSEEGVRDAALVALLKLAQAEGQTHMFAPFESTAALQADPNQQPQIDCNVSVTEPAYSVIKTGMRETLVLLMQNGLKPDEKDDFATSPLDVAHELNKPDMEHVMKTFMARRTVLGILDEMDDLDAGSISKKNTKPSP